jgi:eukaryotic-like serine/threonine-protein kinase
MSSAPARTLGLVSSSGTRRLPGLGRPALPQPGETIAGKYTVVRTIGEGGMGVVYEALHLRLHQRLAIKVLRPDVHDFDEVLARFEREAQITAQLKSIHAARVIDVDTLEGGLPYIVLEFLEGRDLEVELSAAGRLPVADAVDMVLQVTEAMAEAHSLGIVHRDLKPSNLFVCRVNGRPVIKILDFGISHTQGPSGAVGNARLTAVNTYIGTPHYAAPEQLRGAANADARSDIWSLGVVLFELLTGRTPFDGAPIEVVAKVLTDPIPWPLDARPDMPRELARVVMRALQRDPAQRFQTMRDLAAALAPFGPVQTAAAAVADAHRGRGRLGEILVKDGLLTQQNLDRALGEQRRSGKMLGQVLLDMGFVAQSDLLAALAKQQGIVVPSANEIERERRQREMPTMFLDRSPVEGLPRRGHRTTWIAIAVGLPMGILGAVGLALLLKGGSAAHAAKGLVAPTAAVTAPNVSLTPASEPPVAAPAARAGAASAAGTAPHAAGAREAAGTGAPGLDEASGVGAPPPAVTGASSRPRRGAVAPKSTRKAFDPTSL